MTSAARPWSMPSAPDDLVANWLAAPSTLRVAASLWAERLQTSVHVEAAQCPPTGLPPSPLDASVGWLRGSAIGFLEVPCALVADRLREVVDRERGGGTSGAPTSLQRGLPAPLTAAEEGLLAWLVMAWLSAWPSPQPVLAWLTGPLTSPPSLPRLTATVLWRVTIGDDPPGLVRWHVGEGPPSSAGDVAHIVEVSAVLDRRLTAARRASIRQGDALVLDHETGPLHLTTPEGERWRARVDGLGLRILGPAPSDDDPPQPRRVPLEPISLDPAFTRALLRGDPVRLEHPLATARLDVGRSLGRRAAVVTSVGPVNVLTVLDDD